MKKCGRGENKLFISGRFSVFFHIFALSLITHHSSLITLASAAYFNTTSYEARVYSYEPGLLYTFSFPAFYGAGMRSMLNVRADLLSSLTFICSFGCTRCFHRPVTADAPDESARNNTRPDLELQLRWRF